MPARPRLPWRSCSCDAAGAEPGWEGWRMTVLLTGFEAYGGRSLNPSEEIVRSLDGAVIAGEQIQGRCLAVELRSVGPAIRAAIAESEPTLVVCLGLWPGEAMLRLERV